ncbi:MAG: DNA methyltransferase, partial [Oligosphaeraceae bacterium]
MPLIEKEERAIADGNLQVLADLTEHGSIEVFNLEQRASTLSSQQRAVYTRLTESGQNGVMSLISRYYGGVYFSYRQAVQLDSILEVVHNQVEPGIRDIYLAALLSTASDIAYTVGKHFAQPLKARISDGEIKRFILSKAMRDKLIDVRRAYQDWLKRYMTIPRAHHGCMVMQGDYMDCLRRMPAQVRTIYADPPYTRDHYSRFYHVLETMALRDNPALSKTTIHGASHISNGIYRDNRHQSPFCIRSQAPAAFRSMFSFASETGRSLLLSYSPYDE